MSGATREIKKFLTDAQLVFSQTENVFIVTIPGIRKLSTTCSLSVGTSSLTINAFVARKPDENHEGVYRWLLERNLKMYGVGFAVDKHGDIYLAGRVPLDSIDETEVDRLVGCIPMLRPIVYTASYLPFTKVIELRVTQLQVFVVERHH